MLVPVTGRRPRPTPRQEVATVRRTPLLVVLAASLAALALGLGGCGDDDDDAAEPAPPPATTAPATTAATTGGSTAPAPAGATLAIDADPSGALAFVQTTLTAPAGPVTFVLTNEAPVPHNVAVEGDGVDSEPSPTIQGGGTAELTVELPAGEYEYYCDVPGHREAGMVGALTVG
jgi:nitrite reductase (NO-forming)